MNSSEFNQLTIEDRIRHTLDTGEDLFIRLEQDVLFKVYEAGGLFVEVSYDTKNNSIFAADIICMEELLRKYEDQIDLSDLGF